MPAPADAGLNLNNKGQTGMPWYLDSPFNQTRKVTKISINKLYMKRDLNARCVEVVALIRHVSMSPLQK
jgi:hypothetical protein